MKKILFIVIAVLGMAVMFTGCEKEENLNHSKHDTSKKNQLIYSSIFKDVALDESIGDKHNTELDIFFKENEKILLKSNKIERIDFLKHNFQNSFNLNLNDFIYDIFSEDLKLENFDPYMVLDKYKSELSNITYNYLLSFIKNTDEISDFEQEKVYIKKFITEVESDKYLADFDRNGILNMTFVYQSSMEYWLTNFESLSLKFGATRGIPRDKYQDLFWSDWSGGITGGLFGGPCGLFGGMVASSACAAICAWESSPKINNERFLETSIAFLKTELYPEIGNLHNQILDDFFSTEYHNLYNKSAEEREEIFNTFLSKNNLSNVNPDLFNSYDQNLSFNDFDPYEYLKYYAGNLTENTYNLIHEFILNTDRLNSIDEEMIFIEKFHAEVVNSTIISSNDKNGIINMINVYVSSTEYWENHLEELTKEFSNIRGINREDYQKIFWCDFISGVKGGLCGGPVGAAAGLATGSAIATFKLWR